MNRVVQLFAAGFLAASMALSGCGSSSSQSGGDSGNSVATLTALSLTPETRFLPIGPTQVLTATGTYSDGSSKVLQSGLTWTSSNPGAVSVTSSGVLSARTPGSARITAASGNVVGLMSVTATSAQLRSVSVSPASPLVPAGTKQKLVAVASYSDGTTLELTSGVNWASSADSVATIDSAGLLTGRSAGNVTVTASFSGLGGRASVVVTAAQLRAIAITPSVNSAPAGVSQALLASGTYSDGSVAPLSPGVSWSSSNPAVATIDNAGLLSTLKVGGTTITATSGSVTGSLDVNVNASQLQSLKVGPSDSVVAVGTLRKLIVSGVYTDGSTWPINSGVSWSSANPGVATVNESGVVAGVAPGVTEATAAAAGVSGRASITVTSSTYSATTSPANNDAVFLGRIAVGQTSRYVSTITNTGNAPLTFQSVGVDGGGGNAVWGISSNTCGARLEIGSQCRLELTFTPRAVDVTYIGRVYFFFAEVPPETGYVINFSGTGG